VPVRSLVNNIGTDGSGVHSKPSQRYFHSVLNSAETMRFPPLVYVDPLVRRAYRSAERKGFIARGIRKKLAAALNRTRQSRPAVTLLPGC